jgi:riboflavin kinase / FMN adenylyltransferase
MATSLYGHGRDKAGLCQGPSMQIIRQYDAVPREFCGSVVVLGNFDGVHRGHQAVIGQASHAAKEAGVPLVLITFEPHPRRYFRPQDPPFCLTPFRSKTHYLEALGVDLLVFLNFDETLSQKPAEAFAREVLFEAFQASQVVVGYDFVFGYQRKGNVALLEALSDAQGNVLTVIEPVATADGGIYSSTRIREYLMAGNPGHAAALLGRPFEIEGRVVRGEQRGTKLGFPTANIGLEDYIQPAFGVYAVRVGEVHDNDIVWRSGVANLGIRPTVGGSTPLLETHLFDFTGDLYDKHLRIGLIEYIRPEIKFDTLESLRAQIAEDSETARRLLRTRETGAP